MIGRTEKAAALTALLNGIIGVLTLLGVIEPSPELISSMNGVLIPIVALFLGARVARVEKKVD